MVLRVHFRSEIQALRTLAVRNDEKCSSFLTWTTWQLPLALDCFGALLVGIVKRDDEGNNQVTTKQGQCVRTCITHETEFAIPQSNLIQRTFPIRSIGLVAWPGLCRGCPIEDQPASIRFNCASAPHMLDHTFALAGSPILDRPFAATPSEARGPAGVVLQMAC
jgi:hypothetical protein